MDRKRAGNGATCNGWQATGRGRPEQAARGRGRRRTEQAGDCGRTEQAGMAYEVGTGHRACVRAHDGTKDDARAGSAASATAAAPAAAPGLDCLCPAAGGPLSRPWRLLAAAGYVALLPAGRLAGCDRRYPPPAACRLPPVICRLSSGPAPCVVNTPARTILKIHQAPHLRPNINHACNSCGLLEHVVGGIDLQLAWSCGESCPYVPYVQSEWL